jgi:GT2 family glycosyltransferase
VTRGTYDIWLDRNAPRDGDLDDLRRRVSGLHRRPLVSVVTPVWETPEALLRACIDSVRAQVYPQWELCLADDGSKGAHVARVLADYAASDPRIRWVRSDTNAGIVDATNRALALARGEFVAFLDHDDELTPNALYEIALRLDSEPDLDLLYSDEDRLEPGGTLAEPFFKPDWSPELILAVNYVCHLAVYRASLLRELGGLRPGYDGSQDWDLVLRFTEATQRIGHVPKVLYHWRQAPTSVAASSDAKPYAFVAGQRAVEDALARRGRSARVTMTSPGRYRVAYAIQGRPLVSILVPTRDRLDLLRTCVDGILEKTAYDRFEVVILDNGSREPDTLRYLAELPAPHRSVRYDQRFNWSSINNFGARHSRGDYLLFLNNDTEVIEPGWIEAMLEHAQRPEVGAVGAKLLYPDGSIQHAGAVIGLGGTAGHAFRHLRSDHGGYFGLAQVVREYSAVTGACLMTRRNVFEAIGGFDEEYEVAYSDIDFCLAARERGYRVIYTPHAAIYHHECATRGTLDPPPDRRRFVRRWARYIADDPSYSPHLSRRAEDFSLLV